MPEVPPQTQPDKSAAQTTTETGQTQRTAETQTPKATSPEKPKPSLWKRFKWWNKENIHKSVKNVADSKDAIAEASQTATGSDKKDTGTNPPASGNETASPAGRPADSQSAETTTTTSSIDPEQSTSQPDKSSPAPVDNNPTKPTEPAGTPVTIEKNNPSNPPASAENQSQQPEQTPKPQDEKIKELSDKLAVARDKFVQLARWRTTESDDLKTQRQAARDEYNKCVSEYQLAETQIFKDKVTGDPSLNSAELLKEHLLKLRVDEQLALKDTEVKQQEARNKDIPGGKALDKYKKLVEWYSKQNWKTKMFVGATLGIGGAALTAYGLPVYAPLIVSGLYRGLTASVSVFGFKRRAEAKAERSLEQENKAAVQTDMAEMVDKDNKINWDNLNKYVQDQGQKADKKFDETKRKRFYRTMKSIGKTAAISAAFYSIYHYGGDAARALADTSAGRYIVDSPVGEVAKGAYQLIRHPFSDQTRAILHDAGQQAKEYTNKLSPSGAETNNEVPATADTAAAHPTGTAQPPSPEASASAPHNIREITGEGRKFWVGNMLGEEIDKQNLGLNGHQREKLINLLLHGSSAHDTIQRAHPIKFDDFDHVYKGDKVDLTKIMGDNEHFKHAVEQAKLDHHPHGGNITRHPDGFHHGRGGAPLSDQLNKPGGQSEYYFKHLSPTEQQAVIANATDKSTNAFLKSYEGSDLTDPQKQDFTNKTLYGNAHDMVNGETPENSPEAKFSAQLKADEADYIDRFKKEGEILPKETPQHYYQRMAALEHRDAVRAAHAASETPPTKGIHPPGLSESDQKAADEAAQEYIRQHGHLPRTQPDTGADQPPAPRTQGNGGTYEDRQNPAKEGQLPWEKNGDAQPPATPAETQSEIQPNNTRAFEYYAKNPQAKAFADHATSVLGPDGSPGDETWSQYKNRVFAMAKAQHKTI